MKKENIKLDTGRITSFIAEHKMIIAALGGITVGITLASLMGNEKAKQVLRSMGTSLADLSGKVVNDLGGYKQLIAPLFSKTDVQGV
jgi:hypothetical protein